jgi:hypothetical protein
MQIDRDAWIDGRGYDLDALNRCTESDKTQILDILRNNLESHADWRDVEAVAAMDTQTAECLLSNLADHPDADVRLHAMTYLEDRGDAAPLMGEIVRLLRDPAAAVATNLLMTLAEEHPTPEVQAALLDCALDGAEDLRVHAAALALYLAGIAQQNFDWNYRPLFLRFGEPDRNERLAALDELLALMRPGAK